MLKRRRSAEVLSVLPSTGACARSRRKSLQGNRRHSFGTVKPVRTCPELQQWVSEGCEVNDDDGVIVNNQATASRGLWSRGDNSEFYELLQRLAEVHERVLRKSVSTAESSASEKLEPKKPVAVPLPPTVHTTVTAPLPPPLPGLVGEERPPKRSASKASSVVQEQQDFKLQCVWAEDPVSENQRATNYAVSFTPRAARMEATAFRSPENLILGHSCLQRLLLHPGSLKRLVWDLVSMLFLAYDIIFIPFTGAFDPPAVPFTVAMNYTTMVFWSLDIVASMLTGYYAGGYTIIEPQRILRKYLKTWFLLDVLLVGLDWTLFVLGDTDLGPSSAARLGRSLRALRFVRTLRLIRLLKVKRILLEIQDQINTEALSICFRMLKIVLVLIVANHVVACAWYAIGLSGTSRNGLSSWVIETGMEDLPLCYQYVTSLHWSLTQFTPASMEVVPQNVPERIFAVVVLIFAMITFSSFVSVLTASMAELRNISSDEARQFWLLRRYLRDWQVPRRFAMRIQRYLEYAYHKQRQRVQAKDVKLLALLSGPLHDELKAETLSTHLVIHPLFFSACRCLHVFSRSLSDVYLGRGDCAFYHGERGSSMIFVCTGVFSYQPGELMTSDTTQCCPSQNPQHVGEGQWVAEAVLWTNWLHMGDLQALTEAQVITVDSGSFGEAVLVYRPSWLAFRLYAQRFVEAMNKVDPKDLSDLLQNVLSPEAIVDTSGLVDNFSVHKSEATDANFLRWGFSLWSRLTAPCAWFWRRDEVVERPFDGALRQSRSFRSSVSGASIGQSHCSFGSMGALG